MIQAKNMILDIKTGINNGKIGDCQGFVRVEKLDFKI